MREEQNELFDVVHSFKKLKISAILPGISHGEFGVMMMIDQCRQRNGEAGVRISEVVNEMKALPPAVSRSLRTLEERGYIIRTVDKKDRRNTYVELTEEGRLVMEEAHAVMQEFTDAIIGEMGEADMKRLIAYLKKLRAVAAEELEKRKKDRKDKARNEKDF